MDRIIIEPKAKDIGDNFIVRRALPHWDKPMVGPFIFWDHMGPLELTKENEMKVRSHPHIGLATITYLFSGQILHRDSLNNEQYIKPGEVNWMTAGNGIVHSERSFVVDNPFTLEGIQLWVALPKEYEEVDASFYHTKESELPLIDHNGTQLRLIAGEGLGEKSPVPVYSDLFYYYGKTQSKFEYQLDFQKEGAIYIIQGSVKVDGNEYSRYSLICFNKGEKVQFETDSSVEFMFFGGTPFPEKRHIWWNFVSSSQEKIEEAKKRWSNEDFPSVINETERIPLPENR